MKKLENETLQTKYDNLKAAYEDLVKRYNAVSRFAPRNYKCRDCSGYYVYGYICSCGCDNSVDESYGES